MQIFWGVLFVIAAIFVIWPMIGVIYNLFRKQDRPPLITGYVPMLGTAFQFSRVFLEKSAKQHGSAFSIVLAGKRMLFLTNPPDLITIWKHQDLSFTPIENQVSNNAFGAQMDEKFHELCSHDVLIRQFKTGLQGESLVGLTNSMFTELKNVLSKSLSAKFEEFDLYNWVCRMIFFAGVKSMWGDVSLDMEECFQHFINFDKHFPLILGGVPLWAMPSVKKSQEYILKMLTPDLPANACPFAHARQSVVKNDPRSAAGALFGVFWASQSNTMNSAFWTLYHILKDEKLAARVRKELSDVFELKEDAPQLPEISLDKLTKLSTIDATVNEVLRIYGSVMVMREVMKDTTLDLKDGRTFRLKKGEQVAALTEPIHMDSELYKDPFDFDSDRFLNFEKQKFFKNSVQAPNASVFFPFGGGRTLCPGRFFAFNEIRLLVTFALMYADFKLLSTEKPKPDNTRVGGGSVPPVGSVPVSIKLKHKL